MIPTKILKLRERIAARTAELGIIPIYDDRGHHYKFPDSEEVGSVTSKLQVVKDPGLMNWKMNRALEHVNAEMQLDPPLPLANIIQNAKEAPTAEFENAGTIGNIVHGWRQLVFQARIEGHDWPYSWAFTTNSQLPAVISATRAIYNCITKLGAEPLAVEIPLIDSKVKVGGSGDDLWAVPIETKTEHYDPQMGKYYKTKIRWEYWFIDLKTSNIGNKDSYMLQVAAYVHMFKKLYKIPIHKVFILHTSKERFGDYDLIPVKNPERLWQIAKVAFKLSDMLTEVKEIKKLKGVSI